MVALFRYVAVAVTAVTAIYVVYSGINGFDNISKRLEKMGTKKEPPIILAWTTYFKKPLFAEGFQSELEDAQRRCPYKCIYTDNRS
ncbi:hypothetical protein AAVH_39411, partial [Aphelenchoides avenae]